MDDSKGVTPQASLSSGVDTDVGAAGFIYQPALRKLVCATGPAVAQTSS